MLRGKVAITQQADPIDVRALEWVKQNRRTFLTGSAAVIVAALAVTGWWSNRQETERRAERALQSARSSAEVGNLPLATSDLARLVSTYGSTRAAQEATLLLAQVRMVQNQSALVVSDLRRFLQSGPREEFRGPANGLLGAALEETGQFTDAAKAYQAAADATPYHGVKAQYLLDAARTAQAAGDTGTAASLYERIAADYNGTAGAVEAEVRLGELRKSGLSTTKKG